MARVRLMGSMEDYRAMIDAGQAQMLRFEKGFVITQIFDYANPQERVLNVLLLGGEQFDGWKDKVDAGLIELARVNGCNAIEFACRLGIAEKMRHFGYRTEFAVMRKGLR